MSKYLLFLVFAASIYWVGCQRNSYPQGEALYVAYCATCHMEDGLGLKSLIPPLAKADYLGANDSTLACIIRYGLDKKIVVNGRAFQQPMLGIPQLSDVEINNILNYIKNAWGNDFGNTKLQTTQKQLKQCQENQDASSNNSYSK